MMTDNRFLVSVITPVYMAEQFITRSVESALAQSETGEVLLIEDGSPDNSLKICKHLAAQYDKVKLLRHPDGGNHGVGASRNLGMKNANYEFIAFVDADNFFLPGRFRDTKEVFIKEVDCEGVYEAIGIHVENEAAMNRWLKSNRHNPNTLITMNKQFEPAELGAGLISGKNGSLTLDGFVIKNIVLDKSGYMSTELCLHQDTEWIIRCALVSKLYPGKLNKAVAMEGVHKNNRFSAPRTQAREYRNRMKYWLSLYHWAKLNSPQDIQNLILRSIIKYTRGHKFFWKLPREYFPTRMIHFIRLFRLLCYPEIILDATSIDK